MGDPGAAPPEEKKSDRCGDTPQPDSNFVRLVEAGRALARAWQPQPLLTVNAANLRLVRFEGHFGGFHSHDIDECYVVLEGDIVVEIEGQKSALVRAGDAFVVRAGTVHRPYAMPRATILLIT